MASRKVASCKPQEKDTSTANLKSRRNFERCCATAFEASLLVARQWRESVCSADQKRRASSKSPSKRLKRAPAQTSRRESLANGEPPSKPPPPANLERPARAGKVLQYNQSNCCSCRNSEAVRKHHANYGPLNRLSASASLSAHTTSSVDKLAATESQSRSQLSTSNSALNTAVLRAPNNKHCRQLNPTTLSPTAHANFIDSKPFVAVNSIDARAR